jgi:hypothetical protein
MGQAAEGRAGPSRGRSLHAPASRPSCMPLMIRARLLYRPRADSYKYTVPTAWGAATLAAGLLHFPTGYTLAGQAGVSQRNIRWALDYLVKGHLTASNTGRSNVLVAQVRAGRRAARPPGRPPARRPWRLQEQQQRPPWLNGPTSRCSRMLAPPPPLLLTPPPRPLRPQVGDPDEEWAAWSRPEDETTSRPVYSASAASPGADVAAHVSAAFSAGSLLFRSNDPTYAAGLLARAKQLWAAAQVRRLGSEGSRRACCRCAPRALLQLPAVTQLCPNQRRSLSPPAPQAWSPSVWKSPSASTIYKTEAVEDDLAWAAAWLCRADPTTCPAAIDRWRAAMLAPDAMGAIDFSWNRTLPGATALLYAGGQSVGSAVDRAAMKVGGRRAAAPLRPGVLPHLPETPGGAAAAQGSGRAAPTPAAPARLPPPAGGAGRLAGRVAGHRRGLPQRPIQGVLHAAGPGLLLALGQLARGGQRRAGGGAVRGGGAGAHRAAVPPLLGALAAAAHGGRPQLQLRHRVGGPANAAALPRRQRPGPVPRCCSPAQPALPPPPPSPTRPAASAPATRCACTTRAAPARGTWRSRATGACSTRPAPTPTC